MPLLNEPPHHPHGRSDQMGNLLIAEAGLVLDFTVTVLLIYEGFIALGLGLLTVQQRNI